MHYSYFFSVFALVLQGVNADWSLYDWNCCGLPDPWGSASCWSDRSMTTNEQGKCGGCDFGRNPCNCNEVWDLRLASDGNYGIWAPWGNIGWCAKEAYQDGLCQGWNWSCSMRKTHRCYSANCGQHRKRSGGSSLDARAADTSPADGSYLVIDSIEEREVPASDEFFEFDTAEGTAKWRHLGGGKAEFIVGDKVTVVEFEKEKPEWVKDVEEKQGARAKM